jgi:transcriptional regulator with XRE-family HTH domain
MTMSDDHGRDPPGREPSAPEPVASPIDQHVGQRVRARRDAVALSVEALARVLEVAVADVIAYESGVRRIPPGTLADLSDHLGVRATWFFDGFQG